MANHRPKSLNELNNVYDKAMRAERAIKEGSSMLRTPETETAPESESIFTQLENKAAEAQKNQVFDPDITNIANDFLKRYAQPEKPKVAPTELKRPAPSIQVYHTPVKNQQPENKDIPLSMASDFTPDVKPQNIPVHKPAHVIPDTNIVKTQVTAPQAPVIRTNAAETAAPEVAAAPVQQTPIVRQAPVKSQPQPVVDHTPRPAPSRVRITSTERSELMEEYIRVMSDEDDDETSYRKPKFNLFKKKKKYEAEDEADSAPDLYEELAEENYEHSDEEIPVVPFDDSDVRFADEPYDLWAEEDGQQNQAPMSIYDYIEADFDYDEASEDDRLDMSFEEKSEDSDEAAPSTGYEIEDDKQEDTLLPESSEEEIVTSEVTEEIHEYVEAEVLSDEETEEYIPEEEIAEVAETLIEEETAEVTETLIEEETEEVAEILPEEETAEVTEIPAKEETGEVISEDESVSRYAEDMVYPEDVPEEAEDVLTPENDKNVIAEKDVEYMGFPPANMEFEDIFSVSDESKRSHTGGNWNEFSSEQVPHNTAEEVVIYPQEEPYEDVQEYAPVTIIEPTDEDNIYERISEDDDKEEYHEAGEEAFESDYEEDFEAPKKRTFLKILMVLSVVLCLAGAVVSIFISGFMDIDSGELFGDKYRAFTAKDTIEAFGISKGDLIITENIFAKTNNLFVYADKNNETYSIGLLTENSSTTIGDHIYVTQTKDGIQLINRDISKGVVTGIHSGLGTVMSIVCDYGIFIAVSLVIFAIALIICIFILIIKQRRYNDAAAIYDNPNKFRNYDNNDGDNSSEGNEGDGDYYGDYDTDGIEQGLFTDI